MTAAAIETKGLTFRYRDDGPIVLDDVSLSLAPGSRCLLLGGNGAGKTTLLRVLAGRHMVAPADARVLGRAAFHDPSLAAEVAFLGGRFPFDVDVTVEHVLRSYPRADPTRVEALASLLDVDRRWHMHEVSDGQRKRVQILLGLLDAPRVLLLDEVTTDLDVLARHDLLALLARDSTTVGTTVLYATHIFDGLDVWASHLAYLERGRLVRFAPIEQLTEIEDARRAGASAPLLEVVLGWLRAAVR